MSSRDLLHALFAKWFPISLLVKYSDSSAIAESDASRCILSQRSLWWRDVRGGRLQLAPFKGASQLSRGDNSPVQTLMAELYSMPWSSKISVLWSVRPPYSRWILSTGMLYTSVRPLSVEWKELTAWIVGVNTRDHSSNIANNPRRLEQDGKGSKVAERAVWACMRISKGCLTLGLLEHKRLDGDHDCSNRVHC